MAQRRGILNADGGSGRNRLGVLWVALVGVCLLALAPLGGVHAQEPEKPAAPSKGPELPVQLQEKLYQLQATSRDSLVIEIHRYSEMISAMRDSLHLAELGLGVDLAPEDRQKLERSIQNLTLLIEEIGSELGGMDLEIANNQISLLDEEGQGIIINIPEDFVENLDESLSQGLNVLSQMILAELPDTVKVPGDGDWGWQGIALKPFTKPEKRKVIKGNIVKVWDPLQVTEREDIRGNVVVVFGDVEVSGRVDGNVVVVFGDLQLTGTAEVLGKVVAVGGRLDQDPEARLADLIEVDPWRRLGTRGPEGIFNPGPMNFLLGQGEFLAMVIFAVLAFALAPARRLERSTAVLTGKPLPSLGAGLVGSMVLHLLAVVVMAILVLTVIGIPVALLVGVALLAVGILSVGLVALVLGLKVCRAFSGNCASTWLAIVLGLALLHLVSFLGQLLGIWPGLGGLSGALVALGVGIKLAAYLFGLGALVLGRFGSARAVPAEEIPS
jgi:hypothetical protein